MYCVINRSDLEGVLESLPRNSKPLSIVLVVGAAYMKNILPTYVRETAAKIFRTLSLVSLHLHVRGLFIFCSESIGVESPQKLTSIFLQHLSAAN